MAKQAIHDFVAVRILKNLQEARALMNSNGIKKNQRDPVIRELRVVEDYLKKIAYTPKEGIDDKRHADQMEKELEYKAIQEMMSKHDTTIKRMSIEGWDTRTIRQKIYEEEKVLLPGRQLNQYLSKWYDKKEFKDARKEYMSQITRVRLYSKRARLEEIQRLYSDAFSRYEVSKNRTTMSDLIKLLNQARLEEDGHIKNQITINNTQNIQNNMVSVLGKEAERFIMKTLPLREIIVSRVCLKAGYDPMKFMERLHNNFYSAASGMRGMEQIHEKVIYPSQLSMDLSEAAKIARSSDQTDKVDYEAIQDERMASINESFSPLKEQLIKKADQRMKGDKDVTEE